MKNGATSSVHTVMAADVTDGACCLSCRRVVRAAGVAGNASAYRTDAALTAMVRGFTHIYASPARHAVVWAACT